jgi:hypothetical protein
MGQLDDDGPILDHIGLAFVAAHEGDRSASNPGSLSRRRITKTLLAAQNWERSHRSGPDSLRTTHKLPPHRACASWVVVWRWTGRLTHPPFAGSRSRLTNPRDGGCGCRHGRYVERVREWRAWPQLTPLGSRRRRRPHPPPFLCNCVHDSTASACGTRTATRNRHRLRAGGSVRS